MEQWVLDILKSEKEKRKLPLEVKKLNNNYYLYYSTTRWDKKEQKVKKVSDYIGRITPKGVTEKKNRMIQKHIRIWQLRTSSIGT
jgi:hypothetical protein